MHAACLEAEVPGSVSKSEPVQGATIACVTPGTRPDSVRFAHLHAQRLTTLCITAHPDTVQVCRSIKGAFPELSKSRLWGEWSRWASQATKPSNGLKFLRD